MSERYNGIVISMQDVCIYSLGNYYSRKMGHTILLNMFCPLPYLSFGINQCVLSSYDELR